MVTKSVTKWSNPECETRIFVSINDIYFHFFLKCALAHLCMIPPIYIISPFTCYIYLNSEELEVCILADIACDLPPAMLVIIIPGRVIVKHLKHTKFMYKEKTLVEAGHVGL